MLKYYRFISDKKIEKGFSLTSEASAFARDAGFDGIFLEKNIPHVHGGFVSCTHSCNRAYLAFADSPVGIDCERLREPPPLLAEKTGLSDSHAFFREWTKAEALCKASGIPLMTVLANVDSVERRYNIKHFKDDDFAVTVAVLKSDTEE